MEDCQVRSPMTGFRPPRRSPLKSQTYRTLSQILSLFDEQNQPPRLVKFVPYQLSPESLTLDDFVPDDVTEHTKLALDDQGKMGGADAKKMENFSEEKGVAVDESFEGVGLLERPGETQMALDEIADIMSIDDDDDDDGDLSKKNVTVAKSSIDTANLEDDDFNREQIIIDELKAIVDGDFTPLQENNNIQHSAVPSDKIPCGDIFVDSNVTPMLKDGEQLSQNGSKTLCLSPGCKELAAQPSQDANSSGFSKNNMSGAEIALQHKDCVASGDSMLASIPIVADEKMEEGELSDGFETEAMAHAHSENPQLPNESYSKGQLSEANTEGVDVSSSPLNTRSNASDNGKVKAKETDGCSIVRKDDLIFDGNAECVEAKGVDKCHSFMGDGKAELQQKAAKEVASIPTTQPKDLVFYGDVFEGNEIADEGFTSEKQEIDGRKKRKRGPCSKERKERKKVKERKKRAQKNRELGVKRLKLQMVQKPKTISLCRHYIHGRCQEGEKCKFSHDTVPLTKSKPCCYFARHSCMKGDDCPFDHQLSNYPCSNFVSKGFCSRGDRCLFSHKILPKEDSSSAKTNSSGSEPVNASKPDGASTNKRLDRDGAFDRAAGAVLENLGISFKSMDQIIASSIGKAQDQKSNIGPYPVKGTTVATPAMSGYGKSSSKERDGGRLNNKAKERSSSCSAEKNNDTLKTPTFMAPKGINFLSFGRSSSGTANTELPKSDSTMTDKGLTTSQTRQNMSEMVSKSNETLARAQSFVESQEPKNVISVKTPLNGAGIDERAISPSRVNHADDRSAQREEIGKFDNSSLKASKLPTFPTTFHQQAEGSTPRPYKSISNSAQKVLSSTLAFAARCEKDTMVKNHSLGDRATCSMTGKETTGGAGQDDTARALKILDFLSRISKK